MSTTNGEIELHSSTKIFKNDYGYQGEINKKSEMYQLDNCESREGLYNLLIDNDEIDMRADTEKKDVFSVEDELNQLDILMLRMHNLKVKMEKEVATEITPGQQHQADNGMVNEEFRSYGLEIKKNNKTSHYRKQSNNKISAKRTEEYVHINESRDTETRSPPTPPSPRKSSSKDEERLSNTDIKMEAEIEFSEMQQNYVDHLQLSKQNEAREHVDDDDYISECKSNVQEEHPIERNPNKEESTFSALKIEQKEQEEQVDIVDKELLSQDNTNDTASINEDQTEKLIYSIERIVGENSSITNNSDQVDDLPSYDLCSTFISNNNNNEEQIKTLKQQVNDHDDNNDDHTNKKEDNFTKWRNYYYKDCLNNEIKIEDNVPGRQNYDPILNNEEEYLSSSPSSSNINKTTLENSDTKLQRIIKIIKQKYGQQEYNSIISKTLELSFCCDIITTSTIGYNSNNTSVDYWLDDLPEPIYEDFEIPNMDVVMPSEEIFMELEGSSHAVLLASIVRETNDKDDESSVRTSATTKEVKDRFVNLKDKLLIDDNTIATTAKDADKKKKEKKLKHDASIDKTLIRIARRSYVKNKISWLKQQPKNHSLFDTDSVTVNTNVTGCVVNANHTTCVDPLLHQYYETFYEDDDDDDEDIIHWIQKEEEGKKYYDI